MVSCVINCSIYSLGVITSQSTRIRLINDVEKTVEKREQYFTAVFVERKNMNLCLINKETV